MEEIDLDTWGRKNYLHKMLCIWFAIGGLLMGLWLTAPCADAANITYNITPIWIDPSKFASAPTPVTYSQEYYNLIEKADLLSMVSEGRPYYSPAVAADYRTKAILIALEKQNELLAEQNTLLKAFMNGKSKCLQYRKFDGICEVFAWEAG